MRIPAYRLPLQGRRFSRLFLSTLLTIFLNIASLAHNQAFAEKARLPKWEAGMGAVSPSFNGTLPVNDHDNEAREGMPDLDALIEFGPSVKYSVAAGFVYALIQRKETVIRARD